MTKEEFKRKLKRLTGEHEKLIRTFNTKVKKNNGIFHRYANPVVTADHVPIFWRYDLNYSTNPFLMERLGVNGTFNSGACEHNGKILLFLRVEGVDRKSFFAVAESPNGLDNFRFWDYPIVFPETSEPDTNVYDLRVVKHEDGWTYGLFCTERKDPTAARIDMSSAVAQCGIIRTKDFKKWERLPDLKTKSQQQRNVVLHPELVHGKYAFYTRPQDGFIETGLGGGIGWGLSDTMENPEIRSEIIVDDRVYHTIKEVKNGLGPAPIKTDKGWLQLAHGVRNTAAGLRYVLVPVFDRPKRSFESHRPTAGVFSCSRRDGTRRRRFKRRLLQRLGATEKRRCPHLLCIVGYSHARCDIDRRAAFRLCFPYTRRRVSQRDECKAAMRPDFKKPEDAKKIAPFCGNANALHFFQARIGCRAFVFSATSSQSPPWKARPG